MAKFITKKGGGKNLSFGKAKPVKKQSAHGGHSAAERTPQAASSALQETQQILEDQMVQEQPEIFFLKCQNCGVVGEMEEAIEEFECPNCRGIMRPVNQRPPAPQDFTQTQNTEITQLIDEAMIEEAIIDESDDNTPTIAISKEQISEYKKNIKIAKPVDVGMFSSGSTSVSLQLPTKSASAPIDAGKIRAQQELESKVRKESEVAERKKIEESIINRQMDEHKRLEEKKRFEDQTRREEELIRNFREEEERKRLEEEKSKRSSMDGERSARLADQAEKLRQEKEEFEKQKALYERNRIEQEAYLRVKKEQEELEKQNTLRSVRENEEKIKKEKEELEKQKKDIELASRRFKEEQELMKLRMEKEELEKQKKELESEENARKEKEEENSRIKTEWLKIEEQKKALNDDKQKIETDKKALNDDKQKIETDKKAMEDARKKIEEEKKTLEEKKKLIEEEKKKVEEDKKKIESTSKAETIVKPSSEEKRETVDKKDNDKKDDDKKDKKATKKTGLPGKYGKGTPGQRPGNGIKKKDSSNGSAATLTGIAPKDIPDFLTQTNIMRLQVAKKKKIMIIIAIGVVLIIAGIYVAVIAGNKFLNKKKSSRRVPTHTNMGPAKSAVPEVKRPSFSAPTTPEPVVQPPQEEPSQEKLAAGEKDTAAAAPTVELSESSDKAYKALGKKLRKNPASISEINDDISLLEEFIEKYKDNENDPYIEKAKRKIQALNASKDLF